MVVFCDKDNNSKNMMLDEYMAYLKGFFRFKIYPIRCTINNIQYSSVVECYNKKDNGHLDLQNWHRVLLSQDEISALNAHITVKSRKVGRHILDYSIIT